MYLFSRFVRNQLVVDSSDLAGGRSKFSSLPYHEANLIGKDICQAGRRSCRRRAGRGSCLRSRLLGGCRDLMPAVVRNYFGTSCE